MALPAEREPRPPLSAAAAVARCAALTAGLLVRGRIHRLAHDGHDVYRGFYEWDGPDLADRYARALYRVLALVSAAGSIRYQVVPGLRRDEVLAEPALLVRLDAARSPGQPPAPNAAWWRFVDDP